MRDAKVRVLSLERPVHDAPSVYGLEHVVEPLGIVALAGVEPKHLFVKVAV